MRTQRHSITLRYFVIQHVYLSINSTQLCGVTLHNHFSEVLRIHLHVHARDCVPCTCVVSPPHSLPPPPSFPPSLPLSPAPSLPSIPPPPSLPPYIKYSPYSPAVDLYPMRGATNSFTNIPQQCPPQLHHPLSPLSNKPNLLSLFVSDGDLCYPISLLAVWLCLL